MSIPLLITHKGIDYTEEGVRNAIDTLLEISTSLFGIGMTRDTKTFLDRIEEYKKRIAKADEDTELVCANLKELLVSNGILDEDRDTRDCFMVITGFIKGLKDSVGKLQTQLRAAKANLETSQENEKRTAGYNLELQKRLKESEDKVKAALWGTLKAHNPIFEMDMTHYRGKTLATSSLGDIIQEINNSRHELVRDIGVLQRDKREFSERISAKLRSIVEKSISQMIGEEDPDKLIDEIDKIVQSKFQEINQLASHHRDQLLLIVDDLGGHQFKNHDSTENIILYIKNRIHTKTKEIEFHQKDKTDFVLELAKALNVENDPAIQSRHLGESCDLIRQTVKQLHISRNNYINYLNQEKKQVDREVERLNDQIKNSQFEISRLERVIQEKLTKQSQWKRKIWDLFLPGDTSQDGSVYQGKKITEYTLDELIELAGTANLTERLSNRRLKVMTERAKQAEADCKALQDKITALEEDKKTHLETNLQITQELSSRSSEFLELNNKFTHLQERLNTTRAERSQATQLLGEKLKEIENLNARILRIENDNKVLTICRDNKVKEIEELRKDIDRANAIHASSDAERARLCEELDAATQRIVNLNAERERNLAKIESQRQRMESICKALGWSMPPFPPGVNFDPIVEKIEEQTRSIQSMTELHESLVKRHKNAQEEIHRLRRIIERDAMEKIDGTIKQEPKEYLGRKFLNPVQDYKSAIPTINGLTYNL